MNGWGWAWLVGFVGYFTVVETAALVNSHRAKRAGGADPRDTLSEHVWWLAGINTKGTGIDRNVTWWARLRRVLLGASLLWLAIHFMTGGQYF